VNSQYVFLSHDVDWSFDGPAKEHILQRKHRFDQTLFDNTPLDMLYRNFIEYMEIEEQFGVRSTFFFRTMYEQGDFRDYHNDIRDLDRGGWEIGLHLDPSSVSDVSKIKKEKSDLEALVGSKIVGNRVHYLSNDPNLAEKLASAGFVYDSSTRKTKDTITPDDIGYRTIGNIIEFPVTIMDAYLFTYMHLSETDIIPTVKKTLNVCRQMSTKLNVITILWHDNVLKMKGGRIYPKILEFLSSQKDVKFCRGIDLADMIKQKMF
jgi:hypothetical protein